jgi:hypothetical protein
VHTHIDFVSHSQKAQMTRNKNSEKGKTTNKIKENFFWLFFPLFCQIHSEIHTGYYVKYIIYNKEKISYFFFSLIS